MNDKQRMESYVSWWSSEVTANDEASCGLHSIDVIAFLWYSKCATNESYQYDKRAQGKKIHNY
jgi:hypothetical protein